MFLDFIASQLGFLEYNEESSVFMQFPEETRKVLAGEIVRVLIGNSPLPGATLKSANHVRVIMEIVGQSFGLPIKVETIDIIAGATELYRRWLLGDDERLIPPPIKDDFEVHQYFFKQMFNHFSLLFQPQAGEEEQKDVGGESLLNHHVRLCENVLEIYANVGSEVPLKEDTWEHLLKVVLGITDSLLGQPKGSDHLAERLCPSLLKVLFSLWLRSGMIGVMWDNLRDLIWHWRHRMPAIKQWNAVVLGLTNRITRIMYGPTVGTRNIVISIDGDTTEINDSADHYVVYAWQRMLRLLGDLETIPIPANYLEAIKGVGQVANQLLQIGQKDLDPESKLLPPDGNTILHIVGAFIFEAINNYRDGFEKGKAAALEAALSILSSRSRTKFNPLYLAYFYRGLEKALSTEHPLLVSTVILHSTVNLFQSEFPGSHVLIPTYIHAIGRILPETGHGAILRNACIRILGCFTCYPEHFARLIFSRNNTTIKKPLVKTYEEMIAPLNAIMLGGLKVELDPGNLQAFLWVASVYANASIEYNTTFCDGLIRSILQKIVTVGFPGWTDEVMLTCFQILTDLSCVHQFLVEETEENGPTRPRAGPIRQRLTLGSFSNSSNHCGILLVTTLCKFFEIRCAVQCAPAPPLEELVVKCLSCMQTWIMTGDWILRNAGLFKTVLSIIEKCRGDVKGYHAPSYKIKEAASSMLWTIVNQHGQFPPPIGPSNFSSLPSEADLLTHSKLTSKNITCFLFNKTLMSVIREPRSYGRIAVTIILRDLSGKFVWNANLNYFPCVPEHISEPGVKPPEKDPLEALPAPDPVEYLDELMAYLTEEERKKQDAVLSLAIQRVKEEAAHLRKTSFGHTDNTAHRPRLPPQDVESDTTASRLLLAHVGLLSMENRGAFSLLQSDASKPFNFLQNFKNIDSTAERECLQIGVIYVPKGGMSMQQIFDNEKGSQDYFDFLSSLGWVVDLNTHTGFTGGLDPKATGDLTPYYADLYTEVIFHVSTMMPDRGGTQVHKRRLVLGDRVLISWVEDVAEYSIDLLEECKAAVNIVINPLPSGLYRVRIINKHGKVRDVGPLMDEMIVSKHILSFLVRLTSINASRAVAWQDKEAIQPLVMRKQQIDDFVRKHKIDVSLSKFYASQFSMAKS